MLSIACLVLMLIDVNLAWDPKPTTETWDSVRIYEHSGSAYTKKVEVNGNLTTATIPNVNQGTYNYVARSYNSIQGESANSNEATAVIVSGAGKCDINVDGTVNALDLQLMVNAVLAQSGGDVNSDGSTNVLDLQILVNKILGTGSCP